MDVCQREGAHGSPQTHGEAFLFVCGDRSETEQCKYFSDLFFLFIKINFYQNYFH